ncbi:unnamed protein product [Spodoptera littoralis]|uniref:Uncharacterized protein n=1 Tax=Spodoptera littoralis TaxID=7109 RepID=A0A9P0I6J8_SPOLI|nr:unnamed protein product [Spodoptera littoralis]CAH1640325.1 unnamed protein product [Spodoptera littoralis]
MSDSDSDTSNNVFTFQNTNTIVSAKGPNINVSNFSFRNPMTSTMCMPKNFERSRYAESVCDQRSMYYRRETSPMSIRSACDVRSRNYQQYYPTASSQKSMFSGRGGSPMSMRSIDSSASVSAADIAFAFKNVKFNRYDLKVIKDAYHKLMKQRVRKRIEKRRNMRLYLKGSRRRSGYDSGELGSNSSISSDDCRSVKTSYKENMSSNASTRMNLTDFRRTVNDNTFKDCSESLKQSVFKNKFPIGINSANTTRNFNSSVMPSNNLQSNPFTSQKDRFKNGFLLPSQRFNKSVASSVIMENSEKCYKTTANNPRNHNAQNRNNCVSGSEEEEIFSEVTVREKSPCNIEPQRKRSLDSEDECLPRKKKSRVLSPVKNDPINRRTPTKLKDQPKNVALSNSFEFAKPSLPVRKSKPKVQEKLIAKSAQPLTDFLEPILDKIQQPVQTVQDTQPEVSQEKSTENLSQLDQSEATQSDMSSRPSFIKRKLFTQTLDVAEKANVSSDSTNSPQSGVYLLQKEKNKARKVVSNQSCLNREVQDDSNLLDLIHKIVPRDRMNLVTPSDKIVDKTVDKTLMPKDCRILVEKMQPNDVAQQQVANKDVNLTCNSVTVSSVKNSAKTFWDTDFESDAECQTILPRINTLDSSKKANTTLGVTTTFKKPTGYANMQMLKKSQQNLDKTKQSNNVTMNSTTMNNTVDSSMRKFNASTLSIRSHRMTKKPNCCNQTCVSENNLKVNNHNKITVENKKDKSKKQEDGPVQKIKAKENKLTNNLTVVPKAKPTKNDKPNKAKSTTKINTSANEKSSNNNKQAVSPNKNKQVSSPNKNSKKSDIKSKTAKSSINNKKKSEQPNNKIANGKQIDTPQVKNNSKSKPQNDMQKNKNDSPKAKSKSKDSLTTNGVPPKSNNNNTVIQNTSLTGRPWRSCRTPSQSRSIELSRSTQLDTSIENNKSLRSRVINLSSSIENITINIKARKKTMNNNKNISQINTRKSDVSFSLGTGTPTPKKSFARTKANFNRSKRRT